MVKHWRLDYDIYRSFIKIANLEIVYLVRKKLVNFEQIKQNMFKNIKMFKNNIEGLRELEYIVFHIVVSEHFCD